MDIYLTIIITTLLIFISNKNVILFCEILITYYCIMYIVYNILVESNSKFGKDKLQTHF